jgi:hypothetical protein
MRVILYETRSIYIDRSVQRTAVTGKKKPSTRVTENSDGSSRESSEIIPQLKQRKVNDIASKSRLTDIDGSIKSHFCCSHILLLHEAIVFSCQ